MDFQGFVDRMAMPCAVMSVERTPEGACGRIGYHRANAAFRHLLRSAHRGDMPSYVDNQRDPRLAEFCFRAAFGGQRIQDYTESVDLGGWGDIVVTPLLRERDDLGYCQLTIELTSAAEPARMAAVSQKTSMGVIRTCLALRNGGDYRASFQRVLEDIVAETGALAGRIVQTDSARRSMTELCACVRPDAPYAAGLGERAPYEIIAAFEEIDGAKRTVIVTNAQEMGYLERFNPHLARSMRAFGVTSLLLTPLRRGSAVLGFLYLVDFRVRDVVEVKELVELDCFFLGLEISNRRLMDRLEELSLTDALTGLGNRNAMLRRLHAIRDAGAAADGCGVVNLDLNGLKAVNDSEGHAAGDRLLCRAAEALSAVFPREDVFRTGGDEFIILSERIAEPEFLEKIRLLRDAQGAHGVSFALGDCWSNGGSIDEAMRAADTRMYADKQAFYRRHPDAAHAGK